MQLSVLTRLKAIFVEVVISAPVDAAATVSIAICRASIPVLLRVGLRFDIFRILCNLLIKAGPKEENGLIAAATPATPPTTKDLVKSKQYLPLL